MSRTLKDYGFSASQDNQPMETALSLDDYGFSPSKVDTLASKTQEKLENLSRGTSYNVNGYVEDSGNKVWDLADLSLDEQNFLTGYSSANYQSTEDSKRNLYLYGTKDDSSTEQLVDNTFTPIDQYDGMTKLGLSADFGNSDYRYVPGAAKEDGLTRGNYGWKSGPDGIDVNKQFMDLPLQYDAATVLEGMRHASLAGSDARVVRELPNGMFEVQTPQGTEILLEDGVKSLFGSGKSEYYTDKEALFGAGELQPISEERKQELVRRFEEVRNSVRNERLASTADKYLTAQELADKQALQSSVSNEDRFDNFREAMLQRESSGDYKVVNQLGYVGGYQFGAAALEDLGYVQKGASDQGNKVLSSDVWTGKNGVNSLQDFLKLKEVQDLAFEELADVNMQRLEGLGVIDENTAPDVVAGYLASAHLLGAGNAANLSGEDANGTKGQEYFDLGRSVYAGAVQSGNAGMTPKEVALRAEAANMGVMGRFGNAAKGLVSSFVTEGVLDPVDFFAEQVLDTDFMTEEEKREFETNTVGYNALLQQDAMENVGEQWDIATDSNKSDSERAKAVFNGIVEAMTTPELLTTSLGTLAAWLAPGKLLKVAGYGKKGFDALRAIDKTRLMGDVSRAGAVAQKAKVLMSVDGAKAGLLSQVGMLSAALGNINTQYGEFVKNNNGAELEGVEKAEWFATRLGVQMFNQNLDKIVDINIMKNPTMLAAAKDTVKALSNKEFSNFAAGVAKTVGGGAFNMSKEASQEYAQTMMEMFNEKFGSEKFKDISTFVDFVKDEENIREAGIGALAGAGGAIQFEAVGATVDALGLAGKGLGFAGKRVGSLVPKKPESVDVSGVEDRELSISEAKESTGRLNYALSAEGMGVTETNLDTVVGDISNVKQFIDEYDDGSESFNDVKEIYNKGIDSLEGFVRRNPNTKLTKRTMKNLGVDSTVLGSERIEKLAEELEEVEYDDATRAVIAEELGHVILGSQRTYDEEFKTNLSTIMRVNGVDEDRITEVIKTYSNVRDEATTEERGYVTYENRIQAALATSNPNKTLLKKNYNRLSSFSGSTKKAINDIESGKNEALVQAQKFDTLPNVDKSKAKQVKIAYQKISTKKDGTPLKKSGKYVTEPYIVNVKYNKKTSKWEADFSDLDRRLEEKKSTLAGISKALRNVRAGVVKATGGEVVSEGFIKPGEAPGLDSNVNKNRKVDVKYYEDAENTVVRVVGKELAINKVILDESKQGHNSKWKVGGDYDKLNSDVINTFDRSNKETAYTQDDVVLVHAMDTFETKTKSGKKYDVSTLVSNKEGVIPEEFAAAIKGRATIVLDTDHRIANSKLAISRKATILKFMGSEKVGYTRVGDSFVFVPNELVKKEEIEAISKEKEAEKKKIEDEKKQLKRAEELYLRKEKGTYKDGNTVEEKDMEEMSKEFDSMPEEVQKAAKRAVASKVREAKKAIAYDKPAGEAPSYDKRIYGIAEDKLKGELVGEEGAVALLSKWQEVLDKGLEGKALDEAINDLLEDLDVEAKQVFVSWVNEQGIATGKKDLNLLINKVQKTKEGNVTTSIVGKPVWGEVSDKDKERYSADTPEEGKKPLTSSRSNKTGKEVEVVIPIVRKVVPLDPMRYVKVAKSTILNSIPFNNLPSQLRGMGMDFINSLNKVAPKVQEGELLPFELMGKIKPDGKWPEGNYNLKDSPARALLYGKDGKIMPNAAVAMQIGLVDTLRTDKGKLMPGYKDDQSVAAMFQVQEFEVTKEMRAFATEVGAFKKTVANSVGKAVLANMGITRESAEDVGMYNYERLVADVGNLALMVGKEQGLVKFDKESSKKIEEFRKNSENGKSTVSDEANTFFITITNTKKLVAGTKFSRYEPSAKAASAIQEVESVVEQFPSMKTKVRGPLTKPLRGKSLEKQMNTVQNDSSGMDVPKRAQETLKKMMETEYSMEVERVQEFLNLVDAKDSKVKEQFGFIPLDSKKYGELLYEDKEIQESINDSIDKSIKDLRDYLEANKDKAVKGRIPMYFKFVYQTNGRYMLDSNTINPQGNTMHRFFVLPTDMGNKVVAKPDDGTFFTAEGDDISLQVRFAIGQAFGFDVDKVGPEEIIEYGNHMLRMSREQVNKAINDILTTGKAEVTYGEGKNSITKEIEADHPTHTLQALSFLRDFADGKTSIPTFLSEEHDSLTSGFANKLLQMPILDPENADVMHEHLARVGVITQQYMDKNEGVRKLVEDGGVGALLGSEGFYDSYKNLAKKVLQGAVSVVGGMDRYAKSKQMFNTISEALPGSDVILGGEGTSLVIDGAMRKMFKNPFMIFNYSASIGRIKKNLAFDIAKDTLRTTAKGNEVGLTIANKLVINYPNMQIGSGKDVKAIKTGADLVKALRDNRMSAVKYEPSNRENYKSLVDGVQEMAMEVYGDQVEGVFKSEFSEFIEVQDATNDAFKVMFRLFDYQRQEMIKKVVIEKGYISQEDQKKIVEELWEDFPSVMGPLSEKGKIKEVIPVTATKLGSPNVITEAATSPQTVVNSGVGVKTNPVVREMAEAVNAGSVVPYHFIDGSEMTEMFDAMAEEAGILAIHDAVMGAMEGSDKRPFSYNKGMHDVNKRYSIVGAIKEKLDLVESKLDRIVKDKDRGIKKISRTSLKANLKQDGKKTVEISDNFVGAAKLVLEKFGAVAENVEKTRKEWYKKGGVFDTALYGNMINGTPGALYSPMKGDVADTSYRSKLVDQYKLGKKIKSKNVEPKELNSEENEYSEQLLSSFKAMPKSARDYVKKVILKKYGSKNITVKVIKDMLKDC